MSPKKRVTPAGSQGVPPAILEVPVPQTIAQGGRTGITLSDPRQMRAVAHPTRMRLIGLLRSEGPMTATQAGERLGESSGSASFHLRQLARYGMVEETGAGTGRQKPWRATARYTSWSSTPQDPELAEATAHFSRVIAARYAELTQRWVDRQPFEPDDWKEAAQFGDSFLYLTAAELHHLGEQLAALLEPYEGRTQQSGQRPEGARLVTWLHLVFPTER